MPQRATMVGLLATVLAIVPGLPARADDSADAVSDSVSRFIDERMQSHRVPGVVFVMVAGGDIVVADARGSADIAAGREMTLDTPLRVGSISKPVTAALTVLAAERELVDLDVPVDTYLPADLSDHYGPASTIRQILTHRAGYPDVFVGSHHVNPDEALALDEWVARAPSRSLEPDVVASYSSAGFNLIGAALEQVSGMDYQDLASDLLFEPLGMDAASFSQVLPDDVAVGYGWNGESLVPHPLDFPDLVPGAGLVASGRDMGRFMGALLSEGDELLAGLEDAMLTRQGPEPGLRGYSLGFTEWRHGSHTVLYHEGNGIGTTARMAILPEHEVGLFTAVNGEAITGLGDPAPPTLFVRELQDHIITTFFDPAPRGTDTSDAPTSVPAVGGVEGTYVPTRVDTSSPLRLEALVSQFGVESTANGVRFGSSVYVEAPSGMYVSGSDRLLFVEGDDGRVYATRGGTDSYRSASWWETITFNVVAVAGALLMMGIGTALALRGAPRGLQLSLLGTAILTFVWLVLVGYGLATVEVMELFTGLPPIISVARWLALGGLLAAVGSVAIAGRRWWRSGWDRITVSGLAVGVAGLTVALWAHVWRLLPI